MSLGAFELIGLSLFVVGPLVFGYATATVAGRKGHPFGLWFLVGAVGGVIALIVALVIGPKGAGGALGPGGGGGARVPCPRCAEPIQSAAQMCRFCGLMLPPRTPAAGWGPTPR